MKRAALMSYQSEEMELAAICSQSISASVCLSNLMSCTAGVTGAKINTNRQLTRVVIHVQHALMGRS